VDARALHLTLAAAAGLALLAPVPGGAADPAAAGGCSASSGGSSRTAAAAPEPTNAPPYVAKVVMFELTPDMKARVEAHLAKLGYEGVTIEQSREGTSFVFETTKHVAQVERDLRRLEQPALEVVRRGYVVEYRGVDNVAPDIAVLYPEPDGSTVVTEPTLTVNVEVPASDVVKVRIDGKPASRVGNSAVYRGDVTLREGATTLAIDAEDQAKNVARQEVKVTLDTTAPAIDARVKLVVEGEVEPGSVVLINGAEVKVDKSGRYEHEVAVRKGQRELEIVAIDPSGNKTVERKPLAP